MNHAPQPNATIPLGHDAKTQPATIPVGHSTLPPLKMTVRKKLPSGVASNVKQHVTFVLDRSTSMSGAKLDELNVALDGIVRQLAGPENKGGFFCSIIAFNHNSEVITQAQPADAIGPVSLKASGSTNFDKPIQDAINEIDTFKAQPNPGGWHYLQSQVLFLSDGQAPVCDDLLMELQERANVTAVAYGADADVATLSRIASDGQVQIVGADGGALRQFMAQVGATMVSTLKAAV